MAAFPPAAGELTAEPCKGEFAAPPDRQASTRYAMTRSYTLSTNGGTVALLGDHRGSHLGCGTQGRQLTSWEDDWYRNGQKSGPMGLHISNTCTAPSRRQQK